VLFLVVEYSPVALEEDKASDTKSFSRWLVDETEGDPLDI